MTFVTKDGGKRETFPTGSVRDTRENKGRFDLIPAAPLKRLAQLYERGAEKYGDRNWQKGQPLARFLDSAMRHLNDYLGGVRDEDHLIAVAWNVFGAVWTEAEILAGRLPKELGAGILSEGEIKNEGQKQTPGISDRKEQTNTRSGSATSKGVCTLVYSAEGVSPFPPNERHARRRKLGKKHK